MHTFLRGTLPGKSNYFLGNDPDRWWTDIPHYGRIQYHDVYPGIDLVYYGTQGELEYDFVVAPGADPSAIQLKFEGVRDVRIDARGDLVLETESGQIQQRKPFAYQHVNGVRRKISGAYLLRQDQTVNFELGDYDPTQPLVIDPVLIYSTLIGGSGQDFALAIDVDSSGNVYATGYTNSANFPGVGPIQSDFGGGSGDIFATKLNASGTELLYATYLGGSGSEFADIAVDAAGNAYLTGSTSSSNFPTANALQPTFGGGRRDSFVTKLNPTGSALIYSTYLGGSGAENEGSLGRIAVDAAGNASVTGITDSPDFPTKNALQPTYGGGVSDAYVAKLNPGGSGFVYSTYLGGSGVETEFSSGGIAVDFDGNAYVTGSTDSVDFPTANSLQAARSGGSDAFVTKLNPAGSAFVYSTYLGRDQGGAEASDIAVDAGGNAYVTGNTTGFTSSSSFPGAGPPPFPPGPGVLPFDGFVSKLNATGSALVYSRYIATPRDDFAEGITVDAAGNAWVIGSTGGEFPVTPDALFPIGEGSFVVQLDSAGDIVYATFFPPVADIAVDGSGNVYLTGSISNFALPLVTPGAFQTAFRGGVDAYVVKLGGEGVPVTTVSAADFQGRELAADSIVSSFAPDFAERVTQADRIPLPTELDGITIAVIDSTLTEYLAGLIVVTPRQINWVMPPQVAEGPARVTITTQDGRVFSGVVTIGAIAPALFSANADGMGVAAASILRIQADGSQSTELIFDPNVNPPGRAGVPIDLGPESDQVFLVLFGTGLRGRGKKSAVSVTIGGEPVEVQFSGPQGEFVALDQVNVGPLPRSLIGRGELDVALTVDDKQANIVTVTIGAGPLPVTPRIVIIRGRQEFIDSTGPNMIAGFEDVAPRTPPPFTSNGVVISRGTVVHSPNNHSFWFPDGGSPPNYLDTRFALEATFPADLTAVGFDYTCFACDSGPDQTSLNWTLSSNDGSIVATGSTISHFSSRGLFFGITSDTPFRSIALERAGRNWFADDLRYANVTGPPTTPTLISPINNATISQNDPTIGCPSHPTRGFGYLVKFDWTDATSPHGIAGYEIFAKARTAQFPIVDTFVVPSEFTRASCNVFVIDPNLEGWEWRVRARDRRGQLGPWSVTGLFRFSPCRLADDRPCNAPPEAAALPRRPSVQR